MFTVDYDWQALAKQLMENMIDPTIVFNRPVVYWLQILGQNKNRTVFTTAQEQRQYMDEYRKRKGIKK